jgi:23S rRNA pseudouridine1911/1915/1917 synthase
MPRFTVPDTLDGERLDKALASLVPGLSRSRAKELTEAGAVRVDGRRAGKSAVIAAGQELVIADDAPLDTDVAPAPDADLAATLTVRLERPDLVVVEKPAGMPTAPVEPGDTGTLANALIARYPEMAGVGFRKREPGLLHRLDTETSGLVLAARTSEAFDELRRAFTDDLLDKRYLLLCDGRGLPDTGTVAHPLANHPKDRRRVMACIHPRDVARNAPRPAETSWRVIERRGPWALVEAKASKALRHQVRVHFASMEAPLANDELYGGQSLPRLTRHALHASHLGFRGAGGVRSFDVSTPLPPDLQAAWDALQDA